MNVLKKKRTIILIILISICLFTYVYAKYLTSYKDSSLYVSEDFYFDSDLLTKEGKNYKYQTGVNIISIVLKNNEDELRYSESDIDYEVKIVDLTGKSVTSTTGEKIESITGTLKGGKITSEVVTFDNLKAGTYRIEATTKSPYATTLKATFVVSEVDKNIDYEVSDSAGSTVLFLTINSVDYKGVVNFTVPKGLLADNTIEALSNVDLSKSRNIKLNFKENSSYTYKFFKENPNALYSKSDFLIEGD